MEGLIDPNGHLFAKMKPREERFNELHSLKLPNTESALTQDWCDVQLALLESGAKPALSRNVPIDYDSPEHLPSSPLCPRNERYWRYLQGKLKAGEERHGVCWMHGMRDDQRREVGFE